MTSHTGEPTMNEPEPAAGQPPSWAAILGVQQKTIDDLAATALIQQKTIDRQQQALGELASRVRDLEQHLAATGHRDD